MGGGPAGGAAGELAGGLAALAPNRPRLPRGFEERRSNSASGKMAFSATRMPLPMAVARCNWKRSIAVTRSWRLWVGAWTSDAVPAKATTPMRVLRGVSLTKALAAACAAVSRSGSTSFARMLPETSMERITVSCWEGRRTTAAGRAMAAIMRASDSRKSSGGTWRRSRAPVPMASFTMARLA